jgi:L-alanine-DL-glutamate epimerase-like enolase superfamily enzyme
MPKVEDIGDGSQDALVVRVTADGVTGWGECEASPLVSMAAFVTPMSHGACKPVRDVVLGKRLESVADIAAIHAAVDMECMDLLQAAHSFHMAQQLVDYGRVGFLQIDCGRIGGIGQAKRAADYAAARGVTYVNHTFTSHLALCASLQPYAGLDNHRICEYPFAPKSVAWDMSETDLTPDANGGITLPAVPGLGITMNPAGMRPYLVDVEIAVKGRTLYRSPAL